MKKGPGYTGDIYYDCVVRDEIVHEYERTGIDPTDQLKKETPLYALKLATQQRSSKTTKKPSAKSDEALDIPWTLTTGLNF